MIQRTLATSLAVATLALTTGCSTLPDAKAARGTGVTREYAASFDKVWSTLPAVMTELELPVAAENKAEGYLLAQRGWSAFSYGENVAVFVKPIDPSSKTQVEVVSKKTLATNVFAKDWTERILDKLGEKLR